MAESGKITLASKSQRGSDQVRAIRAIRVRVRYIVCGPDALPNP